jgi:RNA polymerase sigma-70 factor (ECF subfamily)
MAFRRRHTRAAVPPLRRAADDAAAFDELYAALAERVLVFFSRRVLDGQLALDLTGETFAIAFQRRRSFRGATEEEQDGWIFAIARSQLSHYWRRGRVEREALGRMGVEVPVMGDAELDRVDELAATADVRARVAAELVRLPPDQRQALQAHVVDERPYAELSAEWGVSEQTIRARVSRGLRSLGATLELPMTENVR